MDYKKLNSLICLLDDPDKQVNTIASDCLIEEGETIISFLENAILKTTDQVVEERIKSIIKQINVKLIKGELNKWVRDGAENLIEGAALIAKIKYFDIEITRIKELISLISRDIWLEINSKQTTIEKIRIFNQIILEKYSFRGNNSNYSDPHNFYINKVVESKIGSPIILAIIYISIGRRLSLPVFGINLPGNFIIAFQDTTNIKESLISNSSFIYTNPFNSGRIFKKDEIDKYIKQHNLDKKDEYYQPCNNLGIIKQLIKDLKYIYSKESNSIDVDSLNRLEEVL